MSRYETDKENAIATAKFPERVDATVKQRAAGETHYAPGRKVKVKIVGDLTLKGTVVSCRATDHYGVVVKVQIKETVGPLVWTGGKFWEGTAQRVTLDERSGR